MKEALHELEWLGGVAIEITMSNEDPYFVLQCEGSIGSGQVTCACYLESLTIKSILALRSNSLLPLKIFFSPLNANRNKQPGKV